ncbi:MAG TPA: hypothetical protein VIC08_00220, partial [Cellvibrionaceae bacterium]
YSSQTARWDYFKAHLRWQSTHQYHYRYRNFLAQNPFALRYAYHQSFCSTKHNPISVGVIAHLSILAEKQILMRQPLNQSTLIDWGKE